MTLHTSRSMRVCLAAALIALLAPAAASAQDMRFTASDGVSLQTTLTAPGGISNIVPGASPLLLPVLTGNDRTSALVRELGAQRSRAAALSR